MGEDRPEGKVPACLYIHQAIERHFSDLKKSRSRDYPFYFDAEAAEKKLKDPASSPHEGNGRAQPTISLEARQLFGLAVTFGWKKRLMAFAGSVKATGRYRGRTASR